MYLRQHMATEHGCHCPGVINQTQLAFREQCQRRVIVQQCHKVQLTLCVNVHVPIGRWHPPQGKKLQVSAPQGETLSPSGGPRTEISQKVIHWPQGWRPVKMKRVYLECTWCEKSSCVLRIHRFVPKPLTLVKIACTLRCIRVTCLTCQGVQHWPLYPWSSLSRKFLFRNKYSFWLENQKSNDSGCVALDADDSRMKLSFAVKFLLCSHQMILAAPHFRKSEILAGTSSEKATCPDKLAERENDWGFTIDPLRFKFQLVCRSVRIVEFVYFVPLYQPTGTQRLFMHLSAHS